MNFSSAALDDLKKRVASINVVVPTHSTKATLTNPDRQEVSVMTMCLVGTPEDNPDYTISEDGYQLIITQAVPEVLMNKNKMFSSKRLGQVLADIWQGAYLESKDTFFENFNLEEGDTFVFKQVIDLPIQVMQNKKHDTVHVFQLEEDGIYVREYRLRGTKVFGNTKASKKLEMFEEDSDSDSDEEAAIAGAGIAGVSEDVNMNGTDLYD